nr:TMV resistance protein N-like [Quercus suber]
MWHLVDRSGDRRCGVWWIRAKIGVERESEQSIDRSGDRRCGVWWIGAEIGVKRGSERSGDRRYGVWWIGAELWIGCGAVAFGGSELPLSEAVKSIVRLISHKLSFEFSEAIESLVGIDSRLVELESCLALWLKDDVRSIGIWAMGGMGKSTLANVAYKMISKEFDDFNKSDWFGSGSRIIITTRDKQLLKEFPVDEMFEVKALNYEDALCLFCSKAFKKEPGPDEYLKLSTSFLEYANGLPLALEVLGSFLFERSTTEWKSALEMLKEDPKPEINQVLKISFDGLPDSVKDIFKDIACLFNHEEKDHVIQMLDSLGRCSHIGLCILIDKSLLKISKNNELWMHNLIEDMGRNMVRQESLEPGERSRLWFYKDIDHVLKNNTVPKYLPNTLRYLDWSDYPAKSLPCFQPDELVQLCLLRSKIELLWGGMKIFDKLKFIDMAGSSNLIIAPNFEGVPNIEKLVLAKCSNLCRLHPSIGKLKKLKLLDLEECQELASLPDKFEIESLVTLNLTSCSKVKKIPEFSGNMRHLQNLLLECTAITELPFSVKCLTGLNILILRDCKQLVCLPNTICSLKLLFEIDLYGCSKFVNLPENLGNLKGLKYLSLTGTAMKVLPSSIKRLTALTELYINDCKNLVCLPDDIGCLSSLNVLHLCGNDFVSLPESISQLSRLESLNLDGCKRLGSLPDIPSQVEYINLNNCTSLERFPEGPKPRNDLNRLPHFNFFVECTNCFKLDYNIQIGSNIPQGRSGKILGRLPYILPGKEIPNGFEKANIRDNSVNIQLPRSGFDELEGTVFCVVFAPSEHSDIAYGFRIDLIELDGLHAHVNSSGLYFWSQYGKVESHHLWLLYLGFNGLPGRSIDEEGFHQVGFTIFTQNVEVETVGFRLVDKRDVEDFYQ